MKTFLIITFTTFFLFNQALFATSPDNKSMNIILLQKTISAMVGESGKVEIRNNAMSFIYQDIPMFCVWDVKADRMRIVSPIAEAKDLPAEFIILALQANYHSVLDPRYAIGDGVMYAAFIHPLSALSVSELESAVKQVMVATKTFGTEFTSGALVFPGVPKKTKTDDSKIIM